MIPILQEVHSWPRSPGSLAPDQPSAPRHSHYLSTHAEVGRQTAEAARTRERGTVKPMANPKSSKQEQQQFSAPQSTVCSQGTPATANTSNTDINLQHRQTQS